MSFQFVRVCDILLYGLNDIFAYVGSIHKTYLLSVIKFVAATIFPLINMSRSDLTFGGFCQVFSEKNRNFHKKIKPYSKALGLKLTTLPPDTEIHRNRPHWKPYHLLLFQRAVHLCEMPACEGCHFLLSEWHRIHHLFHADDIVPAW